MMRKFLIILLFSMSGFVYSSTECLFDVHSVFLGTDENGTEMVWAQLQVPGAANPNTAIYKDKNNAQSEQQRSRLYSMALTAFTAGKKLLVRYPENGLICNVPIPARTDFIGVRMVH